MDDIDVNDIMPNEGGSSWLQVDEDIEREVQEERAKVSGAAPLMDDILSWFEEERTWALTVDGINLESNVEAATQVMAKQQYAAFLAEGRQRLIDFRDTHLS